METNIFENNLFELRQKIKTFSGEEIYAINSMVEVWLGSTLELKKLSDKEIVRLLYLGYYVDNLLSKSKK